MESFIPSLNSQLELLRDYFEILNKLFTQSVNETKTSFFNNHYYQVERDKLRKELEQNELLNYFFTYDKILYGCY